MTSLAQLLRLKKLRQLGKDEVKDLDVDTLQRDMIDFARETGDMKLLVHRPKLYHVKGEEKRHLQDAMETLGYDTSKIPTGVDITGAFNYEFSDHMIFLSTQQVSATRYKESFAYLDALTELVYTEGHTLISNFSVHEALCGKVKVLTGGLALEEAHLFPKKFQRGPYTIRVTLDTPHQAISKYRELMGKLDQLTEQPKRSLLDPEFMDAIKDLSADLRGKLGALTRYEVPKDNTFRVTRNNCMVKDGDNTYFYLYNPKKRQNVMVYFGDHPFEKGHLPAALHVLDGSDHHKTLADLVEWGFYEPSRETLVARRDKMQNMYTEMQRKQGASFEGSRPMFEYMMDRLRFIASDLESNSYRATKQVLEKTPELVEFMVNPVKDPQGRDDVVLHDLLFRLSWNDAVREYHDTDRFLDSFDRADDGQKANIVQRAASNVYFADMHNNDVNMYLFHFHRDLCESAGISFDVVN